jgi:hypothetical protein
MATSRLVDTDVLIDYLRDYREAISYLEAQQGRLRISVITFSRVVCWCAGRGEKVTFGTFPKSIGNHPLDQYLAVQGGFYRCNYGKSHNVG